MFIYSQLLLLLVSNQVRTLAQPLDNQLVALSPEVDVLDIVGGGLEVAGGIVTLRDEDVVVDTALERLVEWDWWALGSISYFFVILMVVTYHELLLNPAEALKAGCELQVVVRVGLCHCGNDGDVVALGAYVVCRRDHGDVDIFSMVSLSIKFPVVVNSPFFLPTCDWGMISWHESLLSVPWIGWFKMQIAFRTWPTT